MNTTADLIHIIADPNGPAVGCTLYAAEAAHPARVLLQREAGARSGALAAVLGWATVRELPTGADWAVAVLAILPSGVAVESLTRLEEASGKAWRVEGIKEIHNGAGFRLALRGTQRGLR